MLKLINVGAQSASQLASNAALGKYSRFILNGFTIDLFRQAVSKLVLLAACLSLTTTEQKGQNQWEKKRF